MQVLIWAQVVCVHSGLVVTGEHVCPRLGSLNLACEGSTLPLYSFPCVVLYQLCVHVIPLHKL